MQPNNCFHPDYYPDIFLPFVWSNFEDWRYDDWQDEYHYDDYPQMSHISPHMATIHLHGCKGGGGEAPNSSDIDWCGAYRRNK